MIYVLVPAYNEAATVGLLLWKVRSVFTAFEREYQLLVVDDCSTDGTAEVLAPYERALPLTVVTHRRRRGYARSLEELLRLAVARSDRPRRDAAVTIQADFSESPDDLPEIVKRFESGADLVLADSRDRPGRTAGERLARRLVPLLARPFAKLDRIEAGVGTLRAYRLATLSRMLGQGGPPLRTEGWAADLELLARAEAAARRVEVVRLSSPVRPRQRASRLQPFRALLGAARAAPGLRRGVRPNPADDDPSSAPPPAPRRRRGRRGRRGNAGSDARPAERQPAAPGPA